MQTLLNDRRVLLPVLLTAVAIAVGSVVIVLTGGNAAGGASAAAPDASAAVASGAVTVDISDFKFQPENLTVKAGTKVSWVNMDTAPHTATARGDFDTGTLKKGDKKTLTFDTTGTFAYVCEIHPFMTGTVTVK